MKQKKEYYSVEHLEKIKKYLQEEKYERALKAFELYFQNYPSDAIAHLYYVDLLMKIGKFEEAEELMERMKAFDNFNRVGIYFYYTLLIKLKCLKKDFATAFQLLNHVDISQFNNVALAYILKQNNKEYPLKDLEDSYTFQQIMDYKEERFLEHVKKHLNTSSIYCISKFNEDFPLQEVWEEMKLSLPTEHRFYQSIPCCYAQFKYDCCGKNQLGENLDYFRVVLINHTKEAITMFPCSYTECIGYTDLNKKIEMESPVLSQTKRLSQIEKFNKRYHRE